MQTTKRQKHPSLFDNVMLYLVALLLTVGIELAIVGVARQVAPKLRETPTLSTCVSVNLLTHPLATLAFLGLSVPFLAVELAVIFVESIAYRYVGGVPAKVSIILAMLTNIASLSAGLLAV